MQQQQAAMQASMMQQHSPTLSQSGVFRTPSQQSPMVVRPAQSSEIHHLNFTLLNLHLQVRRRLSPYQNTELFQLDSSPDQDHLSASLQLHRYRRHHYHPLCTLPYHLAVTKICSCQNSELLRNKRRRKNINHLSIGLLMWICCRRWELKPQRQNRHRTSLHIRHMQVSNKQLLSITLQRGDTNRNDDEMKSVDSWSERRSRI